MHVQRFFKYAEENGAWRGNEFISPLFQAHLRTMERDILMAATKAKKLVTRRHLWSNISKAEQTVITQMQDLDVGVNFADKNLGVVVYDRDLYREQCLYTLRMAKARTTKSLTGPR